MKNNNERLSTSKKIAAVLAVSVAGLAFSGCSTESEGSWDFAVKCPDENVDVNVTEASNGKVTFQCGTGETAMAPESVELISGDGVTIKDSETDNASIVTVGYEYDDSYFSGKPDPSLGLIKIRPEYNDASITMYSVFLTEVSVQTPQNS